MARIVKFLLHLLTYMSLDSIVVAQMMEDQAATLTATYSIAQASQSAAAEYNYTVPLEAITASIGFTIALDPGSEFGPPICAYSTSGAWQTLPRMIYYCSLIFALVARGVPWLVGGVLAAAMGYSSLAALQALFQVWTKREAGELDIIPLSGILATACIMSVPLMNWSSTLRELGRANPGRDEMSTEKKDSGPTRIVIALWSLIVGAGFLGVFFSLQSLIRDDVDWISIGFLMTNETLPDGVTCLPPNNTLDLNAGQMNDWLAFWMTSEFVQANNCQDPCSNAVNLTTLFRSASDLNLFSKNGINTWVENGNLPPSEAGHIRLAFDYYNYLLFFLPFILTQGAFNAFVFWRSSPQHARWKLYVWISGSRDPMGYSCRRWVAFGSALIFYLISVLIVVGALIAFVVNILATEYIMHFIKQEEDNQHVDQWGVFAVAILTVIAAIICQVDPIRRESWEEAKLRAKLKYIERHISWENEHDGYQDMNHKKKLKFKSLKIWEQVQHLGAHTYRALRRAVGKSCSGLCYHVKDFFRLLGFEMYMMVWFCIVPGHEPVDRKESKDPWFSPPRPPSAHEQEERRLLSDLRNELNAAKEHLKNLRQRPRPTASVPAIHAEGNDSDAALLQAVRGTRGTVATTIPTVHSSILMTQASSLNMVSTHGSSIPSTGSSSTIEPVGGIREPVQRANLPPRVSSLCNTPQQTNTVEMQRIQHPQPSPQSSPITRMTRGLP